MRKLMMIIILVCLLSLLMCETSMSLELIVVYRLLFSVYINQCVCVCVCVRVCG